MRKLLLALAAPAFFAVQGEDKLPGQQFTSGGFSPSWESLSDWECPEWFKDAKFGIWAHWGPQCYPEAGDWYAHFMYYPGSGQYQHHLSHYGSPANYGLKEICRDWKAENWNPKELVDLYKSVGARYFMTLANHHDNFDLWESPYQEWNSVNLGPKRDIVGEWSKACRDAGLPLGVSVHASHTWSWLEGSQKFDGKLTYEDGFIPNSDGTEKWWKGLDPQELYAQNHTPGIGWENSGTVNSQWDWGNGASIPDEAYKKKMMNRTLQLVYDYNPDMIYFDDTALPFYGCDEQWGLDFLSSYYNFNAAQNDGTPQVVVTGKQLKPHIKEAMLWDVERGIPDRMQEEYWQTCTCIGEWHYNKDVYDGNRYKSAGTVIRMLVDVISKNGNLLLSIPVKSDGTIDDKERAILDDIKRWMDINSESIYGTRVWKTFGEGPLAEAINPMNAQGFNEGLNYSSKDVRFVTKGDIIYTTIMAWPDNKEYTIKSFSRLADTYSGNVTSVSLLGYGPVEFSLLDDGLHVVLPESRSNDIAPVFEIKTDGTSISIKDRMETLLNVVSETVNSLEVKTSHINSGLYNTSRLSALRQALETASAAFSSASDDEIAVLFESLNTLYRDFSSNAVNPGGLYADISDCREDITMAVLKERGPFARTTGHSRFSRPKNWTVENYSIPNGGDGVKQGIDRYSGSDALSLGIWNDRQANTEGNLANARIYQKIFLPRGLYFFGAAYNTTYNISNEAYMFVADRILPTSEITSEAIAYHRVADCKESNSDHYGLWFYVDGEKDLYLGWQADLSQGSETQEFRASKIALLRVADCDRDELTSLLSEAEGVISAIEANGTIGSNSGQFSPEAFQNINEITDRAKDALDTENDEAIGNAYLEFRQAWTSFLSSRNPGGIEDPSFGTDMTTELLVESADFSVAKAPEGSRFAQPLHWTVENFSIPCGDEGVKQGLDRYSGEYSLMLGVWMDGDRNQEGDLADARIYRKVSLDKGDYFFGARYHALYNMADAYMFCNPTVMPTASVQSDAMAWMPVSEAAIDDNLHGIYFSVTEPGECCLGWQVDLKNGDACKEFRADRVCLMQKDTNGVYSPVAPDPTMPDFSLPYEAYTLQGIRTTTLLPGYLYIIRQNSRSFKYLHL